MGQLKWLCTVHFRVNQTKGRRLVNNFLPPCFHFTSVAVRLPVRKSLPLVLSLYDSSLDVASSAVATSKICLTGEQASSPEFRVMPSPIGWVCILFAVQFLSPRHQQKPQAVMAVISLDFLT